jgi:hypothetical protein
MYRHFRNEFHQLCDEDRTSGGWLSFIFSELKEKMRGCRKDYFYAGVDELEQILEESIPTDKGPGTDALS